MTKPDSEDQRADRLAGWILTAIFTGLGLFMIAVAATIYLPIVTYLLDDTRAFTRLEGMIGWTIGLAAAGAIALGLLLVALGIRFAPWHAAPMANLILSIIAIGFTFGTYYVFADIDASDDSIGMILLQAFCVITLLAVALPPFLHWAWAKPARALPPPEIRP